MSTEPEEALAVVIGQQGPAGRPGDVLEGTALAVTAGGSQSVSYTAAGLSVPTGGDVEIEATGPGGRLVLRAKLTVSAGSVTAADGVIEGHPTPDAWQISASVVSGSLRVTVSAGSADVTVSLYPVRKLPTPN